MAELKTLLLDTHVWLWLEAGSNELASGARRTIRTALGAGLLRIAAISLWEAALLALRGRILLGKPTGLWFDAALAPPGPIIEPLCARIAIESCELPGAFHRDPADRMIVATARVKDAILMTRDRRILDYAAQGPLTALSACAREPGTPSMTIDALVRLAIAMLWLGWLGYWLIAARAVKRARWRESAWSCVLHAVPLVLCAFLLTASDWLPAALRDRFAPGAPVLPLLGMVSVAIGLGFAVWARRHLGRNWSARITVKENHALVRSGPYQVVRHPIYSGLLLALAGTALATGEWRGVLAVACAVLAFALKIRVEESRMRETFPEYEGYRRRVPALVPGLF